jgi:hypothetical protein
VYRARPCVYACVSWRACFKLENTGRRTYVRRGQPRQDFNGKILCMRSLAFGGTHMHARACYNRLLFGLVTFVFYV